jgi:hypothetical protein
VLSACQRIEEPPRMDDLSGISGDYERPKKDVFGGVETATLVVTTRGMTYVDDPMRDSVVFDHVECSSATSCQVKSTLCSLSLEKRPDGDLVVNAELRCERMAGLWHTHDNAKKRAAELTGSAAAPASSSAVPAPSASSPVPAPSVSGRPRPSASGSGSALAPPPATAPEPSTVDCLRTCNQGSMTCARGCKQNDLSCLSSCNEKGFRCVVACAK